MAEVTGNFGALGMDLEQSLSQLKKGKLTYALNAMIEGFDGQYVNYQNEPANQLCVSLPEGYVVLNTYAIYERNIIIYWLLNPTTNDCEIGKSGLEDCSYTKIIGGACLNFKIDKPILDAVHYIDNRRFEVFWVDGYNEDRFIDFNNLPYLEIEQEGCNNTITDQLDCNKLAINPNFAIPSVTVEQVEGDGTLVSGTYQFGVQYANVEGQAYTSVFSITNPLPIFDPNNITLDFNSPVNKSITVALDKLDSTGFYDYFNLVVIKTVNNISSAEIVGTYNITDPTQTVIYVGQKSQYISLQDVFQKNPVYISSKILTSVGGVLVRADLTVPQRVSYQSIANNIELLWETFKLPTDKTYKDPLVASDYKSYMRDEVYAFDIVFLLTKGRMTDKFHIPGRVANEFDLQIVSNEDVINLSDNVCSPSEPQARWRVYNTATLEGTYPEALTDDTCYVGRYQYGKMSYWESEELYPCDELQFKYLAGKKIRHHKMPDCLVSPIHDDAGNMYPLGVNISTDQIKDLINNSDLTKEQKEEIIGYKVVRSNRANNKSIVAKGLIHNVGTYTKDKATYFYPNYPYNDVRPDPFISANSTALPVELYGDSVNSDGCLLYRVEFTECDFSFNYIDCVGILKTVSASNCSGKVMEICTLAPPYLVTDTSGIVNFKRIITSEDSLCKPSPDIIQKPSATFLDGFAYNSSKQRFTFHSPDTHFYQPFLGNILKLETVEYGQSTGHFVQTKEHAKYKLFSSGLYLTALGGSAAIAIASGMYGLSNRPFDGIAFFTSYQTLTSIFERLAPRINYAYHYTSVGHYTKSFPIGNTGSKQRAISLASYILPGVASVGDVHDINNFQRESSVYIRTNSVLPYTHEVGAPKDVSRWLPEKSEVNDTKDTDISSYYAAIKKPAVSQYGQIGSYESVDTGLQVFFKGNSGNITFFGGDVFINKFGYKCKLPYFIDNRVNSLDGSDVFYNEIGNIGNPNYWFSLDSTAQGTAWSLFGIPVSNLHHEEKWWAYKRGHMYLFSYGIPYFYCESEVNVDYRQAFNNKEGDFYPRVSSGIPDEWLQETNVSIAFDNSYHYNKTFSKQNKETFFTTLPLDYNPKTDTLFPFRAVFSEKVNITNNWLIYKPASIYNFAQTYGKLTSLDTLNFEQVLARFENRAQIYNALLTLPSNQADVYIGQSLFSQQVPPIDLYVTDQGFAGSRHRMLLRTEYGSVFVDDKRGHVFLLNDRNVKNLTATESGVEQFFNKNLEIQLVKHFSEVNIDNHYTGVGIHGVFDAKYDRLILTKIDYIPLVEGIKFSNNKFYMGEKEIFLSNTTYFCNKSFTISYDFYTQSWISFHSYIPNYYVGHNNFFYSGTKNQTWKHLIDNKFLYFYGKQEPYVIEYPFAFQYQDEILQSVADYCKTYQYIDGDPIEVNDVYYNKCILYNNQQCSGVLELQAKPRQNMSEYMKYPIYKTDSKTILYTKSDNLYKINQFWSLVKDVKQPIFKKTCQALSIDKELNQENMNYSKMTWKKAPLRAKDLKCRFILDNRNDTRIVSQLTTIQTQKSFK